MTTDVHANEKEFVFEDWLAEGLKGIRAKSRAKRKKIIPETFCVHMRASRKEFLLALRSLVDEAVKHMDAEPEPPKKATKIKVE